MSDSPSVILSRAADLIRDTAAAATRADWKLFDGLHGDAHIVALHAEGPGSPITGGDVAHVNLPADARWIALMSPAVAGPVERLLREAAESAARHVPIWAAGDPEMDVPARTDAEVADLCSARRRRPMADEPLPEIGSRWVDTTGLDGEITVTGHDKGSYVLAERHPLDEGLYINHQHFGTRYKPSEELPDV